MTLTNQELRDATIADAVGVDGSRLSKGAAILSALAHAVIVPIIAVAPFSTAPREVRLPLEQVVEVTLEDDPTIRSKLAKRSPGDARAATRKEGGAVSPRRTAGTFIPAAPKPIETLANVQGASLTYPTSRHAAIPAMRPERLLGLSTSEAWIPKGSEKAISLLHVASEDRISLRRPRKSIFLTDSSHFSADIYPAMQTSVTPSAPAGSLAANILALSIAGELNAESHGPRLISISGVGERIEDEPPASPILAPTSDLRTLQRESSKVPSREPVPAMRDDPSAGTSLEPHMKTRSALKGALDGARVVVASTLAPSGHNDDRKAVLVVFPPAYPLTRDSVPLVAVRGPNAVTARLEFQLAELEASAGTAKVVPSLHAGDVDIPSRVNVAPNVTVYRPPQGEGILPHELVSTADTSVSRTTLGRQPLSYSRALNTTKPTASLASLTAFLSGQNRSTFDSSMRFSQIVRLSAFSNPTLLENITNAAWRLGGASLAKVTASRGSQGGVSPIQPGQNACNATAASAAGILAIYSCDSMPESDHAQ